MTDPDDLLARLRQRYKFARTRPGPHVNPDGLEAASEIERLRAEADALRARIAELEAALKTAMHALILASSDFDDKASALKTSAREVRKAYTAALTASQEDKG